MNATKYLTPNDHESIKSALQAYAWPGGYPVYLVMQDGGSLCPKCLRKNLRQVLRATRHQHASEWAAQFASVNWEDDRLTCDECDGHIEAAYEMGEEG